MTTIQRPKTANVRWRIGEPNGNQQSLVVIDNQELPGASTAPRVANNSDVNHIIKTQPLSSLNSASGILKTSTTNGNGTHTTLPAQSMHRSRSACNRGRQPLSALYVSSASSSSSSLMASPKGGQRSVGGATTSCYAVVPFGEQQLIGEGNSARSGVTWTGSRRGKADRRYESLERILNKTTVTTQRVTHVHILDISERMMTKSADVVDRREAAAIEEALTEQEQVHQKRLVEALGELKERQDREKEAAVQTLKEYYDTLIQKERQERDQKERENIIALKKNFVLELTDVLRAQETQFASIREAAILESCKRLKEKLNQEFLAIQERAIATAIEKSQEQFRKREEEMVNAMKAECLQEKCTEIQRLTERHRNELKEEQNQNTAMAQKYTDLLRYTQQLSSDFKELQADYKRFIDHTDRYHSDYLMTTKMKRK